MEVEIYQFVVELVGAVFIGASLFDGMHDYIRRIFTKNGN